MVKERGLPSSGVALESDVYWSLGLPVRVFVTETCQAGPGPSADASWQLVPLNEELGTCERNDTFIPGFIKRFPLRETALEEDQCF